MSSATSDEDEEYAYGRSPNAAESDRYPIHDCCEFKDAEDLREDSDDDEDDDDDEDNDDNDDNNTDRRRQRNLDSSSSSDENTSTEAAHAAAIGHSPQPNRPAIAVTNISTTDSGKVEDNFHEAMKDDKEASTNGTDGTAPTATPPRPDELKTETSTGGIKDGVSSEAMNSTAAAENEKEQLQHDNEMAREVVENEVLVNDDINKKKKKDIEKNIEKDEVMEKQTRKAKKRKYYCPHNLNDRDGDENTPLHIAIHSRKLEHVKLLLEAGASVHKKNDGSSPIHTAISIGAVSQHEQFAYECVAVLNEYGADLTAKDDAMHTPLYLACKFNLPQIASYLLNTEAGLASLNTRADRSGGRPLHAAAKFDSIKFSRAAVASVTGHTRAVPHHHPDGTVINSMNHIPGYLGKMNSDGMQAPGRAAASDISNPSEAVLTHVLLGSREIEIDPLNTMGQTPLHLACLRGNWTVVRLLLQAGASPNTPDRRGYTPGQLAHKRGMPIPNDLMDVLGDPPSSGAVPPPRDLIVDPDESTLILCHELCSLHRSCPPIRRDFQGEPPPENVRRLHVLVDNETGILKTGEFGRCMWTNEARRVAMVDVFKCHEYSYVEQISQMCSSIPDHPNAIAHLDADTTMSRWSFEAALRAAGSVCEAVDKVMAGDCRNAFCAVRPPGHHAGPRGIVRCANDPEGGSHGFCLLNNVAIGAAYARSMYRNEGIKKIAIVDFDVHHGNGTEEIIRNLVPNVDKAMVRTPFAMGELVSPRYRPWLDEGDVNDIFFASTHGYGPRGSDFADAPQGGWFYPASGKTHISDAIMNPTMVETPSLTDFLSSQTWTRMGEDSRLNCCKIINCGLGLPDRETIPGMQRLELRDNYRTKILPRLREFDPDIVFISAGFDAHKKDTMNFGYVGMVEDDYEWVTDQLIKIANTCCNGRIVSVLEGGYKIHGGIVSPFARSVASHVRSMVDGGRSRELYDSQDGEWESQFERHLIDERERKRQQKIDKLRQLAEQSRRNLLDSTTTTHNSAFAEKDEVEVVDTPEDPDAPSRKRRRNQVDYRELYEHMKREGFAG